MKLRKINFIKVDIEAAEYMALLGMKGLLKKFKPSIMFEVTRNHKEIFEELSAAEYLLFDDNKKLLNGINYNGNIFGVHKTNTPKLLKLGLIT
jgi:hypothetical protein